MRLTSSATLLCLLVTMTMPVALAQSPAAHARPLSSPALLKKANFTMYRAESKLRAHLASAKNMPKGPQKKKIKQSARKALHKATNTYRKLKGIYDRQSKKGSQA
jgi:hypothetical protein